MLQTTSTRITLAVPALILLIAAVLFVPDAIDAWGAANVYNQPSWAPTFLGFWTAAWALFIGGRAIEAIWKRTRAPYRLAGTRLQVYGLLLVIVAVIAILFAVHLPDQSTYHWLLNSQNGNTANPGAFVFFSAAGLLLCAGIAAWLAAQYVRAITPDSRRRASIDAVGELIREREQG